MAGSITTNKILNEEGAFLKEFHRSTCLIGLPRAFGLFFLIFAAAAAWASPQTASTVPTPEIIVARMAQARADNQIYLRSYIVTRDYQLFGEKRKNSKSQVIADVTFVPPDSKRFSIQETNGTGLGVTIIRRILASEVEITKDYGTTDFTAENYEFRFDRKEDLGGRPCYILQLLPRRNDKHLLRGNIWVDASTYLVRRAEGTPAKTPSWWVRDVRIALFYGDVGGMWLQTASEGTAAVRILGQFMLVSRDVKYKISETVASANTQTGLREAR